MRSHPTDLHIPLPERQCEYSPHPIHPNFRMNSTHSSSRPSPPPAPITNKPRRGRTTQIHLFDRRLDPAHPQPARGSFNTTHTPSGTEIRNTPHIPFIPPTGRTACTAVSSPPNRFKNRPGKGTDTSTPAPLGTRVNQILKKCVWLPVRRCKTELTYANRDQKK